MRNLFTFSSVFVLLLFTFIACSHDEKHEEEDLKIPLKDRIDLAMKQETKMTKDPALGYVPKERLLAAKEYRDKLLQTRAALPANWTELGPNNVGGRTRCLLIDVNDATGKTVWAGSVGGGLWKTTDITLATPDWNPVDDLFGNLAITCIAQDPSTPNTIYFGTGEGYFNGDAIRGFGIWKTTDGGITWGQLASTTGANFQFCQKMVVNNTGILLVSTRSAGLQRSTNGGTSFGKVLGTGLGITGAGSNNCYDVDIAANGDIYATLDGSAHKSTNAGVTFAAAMTFPITLARIEIALAPNDANYAYALVENANVVNGILRTTNGGTTWTSRTEPDDADPGIPAADFSRGQAWYDLTIAVDPNNRDALMVGGVDLFKSTNGAGTWTQIAHWYGGFGQQYVHADQHNIVYRNGSSTEVYFTNDGGVWRSTNGNVAVPTIAFKGDNYNVTQFYACAIHPTALTNYYLAGSQDNGSHQFTQGSVQPTVEVTGGDGAFCHIDQNQPQYQFTSYVYNDFYRSTNSGSTWTNVTTSGGDFISPTDYDNVNNRMYMCDGNNNYRRWDNPQTGSTFAGVAVAGFGGQVTAVTVSPNTANRVFFGIDNGRVFRVDNAHTGAPAATNISTGLPGGYPACVEVETGNDNHLLVTYTNYGVNSVWESTNGGTNWTSVEGNLPDMPIRWALFNPNNNDQAILATELGVWSTDNLNGGATVWGTSNSGLANVSVDMLQLRASDKYVIAATHGRGLFGSDMFADPTALFTADKKITYKTVSVQFTDLSYQATAWSWNFGDGNTSALQHPTHSYTTNGIYNVSLTINGGASNMVKASFIQVLPDRGTPYNLVDGGNFEINPNDFGVNNIFGTGWQRGSSAVAGKNGTASPTNAWVTGLVGAYVDNASSQLWTPCYNMTAIGTYTLGFFSKFNAETGFDGFRVEYSLDRGLTWTALGTTVAAGWYNNANNSGSTVFPANQAFFSGNVSGAFNNYIRDISFLGGNNSVAFRFPFGSDGSVTGAGVALDNFTITGAFNSLPVQITAFTGEKIGEKVALTWKTQHEINLAYYNVERSDDGNSFEDIGKVAAKSGQTNEYVSYDPIQQAESYFYYRLNAIDLDNTANYSNIIKVYLGEIAEKIVLSPNPFRDFINIESHSPVESVTLWDMNGKEVFRQANVRDNKIYVDRGLASGNYAIKVKTAQKTHTQKVVHIQ